MKSKNQNEELQSRREFFKEAAKKVLPVIGAIALASSPIIAQAAEKTPMGCNSYCTQHCSAGCATSCSGRCQSDCQGSCKGGCGGGCGSLCARQCSAGCAHNLR